MAENYFQVDKISVKYGDIQVLWDISFEAAKGEIIALVGSNGAGKSTAVKAASGLVKTCGGKITFDGQDVTGGNCRSFIDHGIILCPEGRQLFPQCMRIWRWVPAAKKQKQRKKIQLRKFIHGFRN